MSPRAPSTDVRAQLSAGLADLVKTSEAVSFTQRRNLLLDRCGSDHRPLVELLLRVGRHGIEDTLRKLGRVSARDWPARRASFVARVTNDLFVPSELAAWAVDSWAVAVGALSSEDNTALHDHWRAQQLASSASRPASQPVSGPPAGSAAPGRTPQRRGPPGSRGPGRTTRPPGAPTVPGAYGAGRAARGGVSPGSRSRQAPIPLPSAGRVLAIMATAVAILAVLVATGNNERRASASALRLTDSTSSTPRGIEEPAARRDADGSTSAPAPGQATTADLSAAASREALAVGQDGRVNGAPDDVQLDPRMLAINREVIRRTAIGSSAEDVGPLPRPLPSPQPLPGVGAVSADLDTVVMDDGGILVGAIRLVAPNDLFVHDVASGMEYALPRSRVARVVTRTGANLTTTIRAIDSAALRTASTASAMLDAGVGGTYRVEQRVRSVAGNSLCAPVAEALERDVIRSVEEVLHEPGTRAFTLLTRPGVEGTLDANGRFATTPFAGSRDGVRFVFRMSGQFTPGGFTARTVTETESIIRYRRTQACRIVADLLATRTLGGAP